MKLPMYTAGKEVFAISFNSQIELFYFTKPTYIPSEYTIFIYQKNEIDRRSDLEVLPMSIENILLFIKEREYDTYYKVVSEITGVHYTFEEFVTKYTP